MSSRAALILAAACAASAGVFAHVRLVNPSNGSKLRWVVPESISIVIQATGSQDIHDQSHLPAIRNAIRAWNAVEGSSARLVEDTSPAQMARSDWQSDGLHLVTFDEDDDSGYFPLGSATVALTPVWFTGNGVITDADVLFNGRSFSFTTSGAPGRFDVQDVATHELGHLLGLDHSGWAGGTMYPYVDPTVLLHRSLSADEVHGLRDCYPTDVRAQIHGTLERANGSAIRGAQIVAVDAEGRTAAACLSETNGSWRLRGLDAGSYTLYATPLDEPVSAGNLGPGHSVQVDFGSSVLGSVVLAAGQDLGFGTGEAAADTDLELGRVGDDFPRRLVRGASTVLTLHGSALYAGCTLSASAPEVTVTPLAWYGGSVTLQVDVPAGAAEGNFDLTVANPAGAAHTLVGGLEITPADPHVTSVSPVLATDAGGTLVTLFGTNFRAGQCVVIGSQLYPDGSEGGCHVIDAHTIQLRTHATDTGSYDVAVIDPSGVEGRKTGALAFAHIPEVQSTFPAGGWAGGGTTLVLHGQNFAEGAVVRIDDVQQSQVVRVSSSELVVTTSAGVPGGPYVLEVVNPGGAVATSAFTYGLEPDPVLDAIDPPAGSSAGGDLVLIHGSNFSASTTVRFGVDADTGQGGTNATEVHVIDAQTLEVVTPAFASGAHNVAVLDTSTGQATLAVSAFTFESSGSHGGGCYTLPHQPPAGPGERLAGLLWLLVACACAALHGRRERVALLFARVRAR